MPHGSNCIYPIPFPNVTNLGEDRFIGEIEDGTLIGYKYFDFKDVKSVSLTARFENEENKVVYEGPIRIDERGTGELGDELVMLESNLMGSGEYVYKDKSSEAKNQDTDRVAEDSFGNDTNNSLKKGCYFEIKITPDGESVGRVDVVEDNMDSETGKSSNAKADEVYDKNDCLNSGNLAWNTFSGEVDIPDGVHAFYLIYHGGCKVQLKEIEFN